MCVYNLGSINRDHVYTVSHFVRPGETLACEAVACFAGGKGYNQSIALARAGAAVAHIGAVGEDGRALVGALAEAGVNTDGVSVAPDVPTGHAIIQVDLSGQNCILIAPGANATLAEASITHALAGAGPGDWLLAQHETASIDTAIRVARRQGLRVALNPAPMTRAVAVLPLGEVDDLIVNTLEGAELLAHLGGGAQEAPEAVLHALHARLPRARIVLTLGGDGAMNMGPDGGVLRVPAFPVRPVDTTAAGDTFVGYYLAALAGGESPTAAMRLASAAAAISVTRAGASASVPLRAAVEAWLAGRE